jgi:predicted RNase H-like nuclease
MADEPLYVGVDWSGGSWVAVSFGPGGFEETAVFDEIGGVWLTYEERAERILVDVPVGLLEGGSEGREVERLAREVLGKRRSAVLTPPVREATRKRRYTVAARAHERKTGGSLSKDAFEMSEAIAAVDELLQEIPETRGVVAEANPEVCFRAFASETLEHPETVAAGYAERMRALADYDRDAPPTVQRAAEDTAGHGVSIADVLDAVALAYTAAPGPGTLRTLPADPPLDETGLPMAIHYRAEQSLR